MATQLRILIITPHIPSPQQTGGVETRLYHLIRAAARHHDVTVLCPLGPYPENAAQHIRDLGAVVSRVMAIPLPGYSQRRGSAMIPSPRFAPLRRTLRPLRWLTSPLPAIAAEIDRQIRPLLPHLQGLLEKERFDVLQVEGGETAHIVSSLPEGGRRLLMSYSALDQVAQQSVRVATSPPARLLAMVDAAKWSRYQQRHLPLYHHLCVVSEPDRHAHRRWAPSIPIDVVPNGVDTSYFTPSLASPTTDIVLIGNFVWPPNLDAAHYLAGTILPLVARCLPDVHLFIVGRGRPSDLVSFRGYPRVTTTGAVADVRPYLARAAVVAVPLRYGGGTRLKILEALAAGKAVVSTSLGAEGLELQDGQHLILADTPQAFADALIRLLTSPEEQRRLGTAGRDQVVKAYDWSVISERLLALYENVAQGSTCSPHRPSSTRERAMQ